MPVEKGFSKRVKDWAADEDLAGTVFKLGGADVGLQRLHLSIWIRPADQCL